ncbi:hypothetical protein AZE42_12154 [Rhizopogon vesiculosus]|uniref:Uncharacterized protein n=1 Tax=Rhizopogon vesiculosus TaxID=180088 RepID=A0A1J8PY14_9AGAM|nr:hypothetical protein AZE42_12154 [Rhizopogon vesiculosus]
MVSRNVFTLCVRDLFNSARTSEPGERPEGRDKIRTYFCNAGNVGANAVTLSPFPSSTSMSVTNQNTRRVFLPPYHARVDADFPGKESNTLEQILDVLRGSTISEDRGQDIESSFWATYKKVSNEHDD